jgi:acyl-coenzyme A synthetase/AMP-(fatty) acid ligase
LTLICPEPGKNLKDLKLKNTRHTFIFPDQFPTSDKLVNTSIKENSPAYMMFTSGTTGDPKGILVSHTNLIAYCNYALDKYKFTENDRISHTFDISFDLSVHDIFLTFLSGGCLYVMPKKLIMFAGDFIRKHELTVWFSVPSVAMFMDRTKTLKKNSLPSLRFSLFCGEGLPCDTAQQWQSAATNSIVDNLYGPTEATIAFMDFRWNQGTDSQCVNGIVPIGKPFKGLEVKLMLEQKESDSGEIYVSGNQVVKGYFKNDKLTKEKFVFLSEEKDKIWYRTGDLAKKIDNNNYAFLGRVDDQIQIRGYRVEVMEIDKTIRDAVGHQMAVSIPILSKENNNLVEDVMAFVEQNEKNISEDDIKIYCKSVLPDYMIPSKIYVIPSMPLNENGKIDKKALLSMITDEKLNDNIENNKSTKKLKVRCSLCLKSLKEDEDMNGIGLLKILNHKGNDEYICHVCLKGF